MCDPQSGRGWAGPKQWLPQEMGPGQGETPRPPASPPPPRAPGACATSGAIYDCPSLVCLRARIFLSQPESPPNGGQGKTDHDGHTTALLPCWLPPSFYYLPNPIDTWRLRFLRESEFAVPAQAANSSTSPAASHSSPCAPSNPFPPAVAHSHPQRGAQRQGRRPPASPRTPSFWQHGTPAEALQGNFVSLLCLVFNHTLR